MYVYIFLQILRRVPFLDVNTYLSAIMLTGANCDDFDSLFTY